MRNLIKFAAVITALSTLSSPGLAQDGIRRLSDIVSQDTAQAQPARQIAFQPSTTAVVQGCSATVRNGQLIFNNCTAEEILVMQQQMGGRGTQPRERDNLDRTLDARGRMIRQDVTAGLTADFGHTLIGVLADAATGRGGRGNYGGYNNRSYGGYSPSYSSGWGSCDSSRRAC